MATTLTKKQREFCMNYACNKETLGNGAQSYGMAYRHDMKTLGQYRTAKSNAYKLLQKPEINAYIDELLGEQKIDDRLVNSHLWFLITQNADPNLKLQAISTFLRFRERQPHLLGGYNQKAKTLQVAALEELQNSISTEEEGEVESVYDEIEAQVAR